jgi:hypothetical protein
MVMLEDEDQVVLSGVPVLGYNERETPPIIGLYYRGDITGPLAGDATHF